MATSLISMGTWQGLFVLNEQCRVVLREKEEPYTRMVLFKPSSFDASHQRDSDGFLEMDLAYKSVLADDNSKKNTCRRSLILKRIDVLGSLGSLGAPQGAFYEMCNSSHESHEWRATLSNAVREIEANPGRYPGLEVWTSVNIQIRPPFPVGRRRSSLQELL